MKILSAAPKGNCARFIFRVFLFTPQQLPARRLAEADYQYITEIWETFGKHYEHELHILHPISSNLSILIIFCLFTNFLSYNF